MQTPSHLATATALRQQLVSLAKGLAAVPRHLPVTAVAQMAQQQTPSQICTSGVGVPHIGPLPHLPPLAQRF